jgi:hypothetical protein
VLRRRGRRLGWLGGRLTINVADPSLKLLAPQTASERFWRSVALFLPGLAGSTVLFLTLDIPPAIRTTISGTDVAVRFRLWSFNAILLLLGLLLGAVFAHRAGFVSLAAHRVADARKRLITLSLFVILGAVVGLAMVGVDSWLTNVVPGVRVFIQGHGSALAPLRFPWGVRALYGGVTEELMWRWGVMSLTAWLLLRWWPRRWALIAAIALSALFFGLDHLPLLFQSVPDVSAAMSLRVVLLNSAIGLAFGAAYAYHSLEAAMIMHATMHIFYFGVGIGCTT